MKKNTQDQERAQRAFACVNKIAGGQDAGLKKKYSTQCRRLPQLIQQCGLCQTVAFLQSKPADPGMARALEDFAFVVLAPPGGTPQPQAATEFAKQCREFEVREYQWLSRHALHCATWMKRYAEALLPKEDS
jgi:CRISPR/Cas system CMR-associated protein Cmr5 small subunit